MADKEPIIVAIELGTSRISGIAGKKKDGNLQILAYAEDKASGCIKRGLVFNIDKTTRCIQTVISKLQSSLKLQISQIYVGLAGQSLRSVRSEVQRDLVTEACITADHIDSIRTESYGIGIPSNDELLENVPQKYVVDGNLVNDPVGVNGTIVKGEYINVVANKKLKANIETCFNNTNVRIADTRITAYELAKCVLTDQEKRAGSVLVDLGGGTTTVIIYRNNILRHLVTLPIGMANITQDLMTLQMDEQEAEMVKIKYGNAYLEDDNATENEEEQPKDEYYENQYGHKVKVSDIQHYIYARLTEILENVKNQINKSGLDAQSLLGGIVLTGGGTHMKNIEEAFRHLNLKIDKVRVAHAINEQVIKNSNVTRLNYEAGEGLSIISILSSGDINCVGDESAEPDIWDGHKQKQSQQQQAEQERLEKEDNDTLQKLEQIKDAVRVRINEINELNKQLNENLDNRQLRNKLITYIETATSVLDSTYSSCRQKLENKKKYEQALNEASNLEKKLKDGVEAASETIKRSKKETSIWNKAWRTINDIVSEEE